MGTMCMRSRFLNKEVSDGQGCPDDSGVGGGCDPYNPGGGAMSPVADFCVGALILGVMFYWVSQ
jgi:hypothetical protein